MSDHAQPDEAFRAAMLRNWNEFTASQPMGSLQTPVVDLLNSIFRAGYSRGYIVGYDKGYDDGHESCKTAALAIIDEARDRRTDHTTG